MCSRCHPTFEERLLLSLISHTDILLALVLVMVLSSFKAVYTRRMFITPDRKDYRVNYNQRSQKRYAGCGLVLLATPFRNVSLTCMELILWNKSFFFNGDCIDVGQ